MPERLMVRHCAPTLAGLKTGSLFSCRFGQESGMIAAVRVLNQRLGGFGVRVIPLRERDGATLVYVCRPERLEKDLARPESRRLLEGRNYPRGNAARCVGCLRQRLAQAEFPHEIGLFLGYPPEDVEGFILRREEVRLSGCWKVYGNAEAAGKLFARYRKCIRVYQRCYAEGCSLERLTIRQ